MTLIDWMSQWGQPGDDMQTIRGTLGRLLFSQDHINKSVKVLSGGEQRRMLFGRIILQRPNVIIMDEPTNHLDMESIESLNLALSNFDGTIIFVRSLILEKLSNEVEIVNNFLIPTSFDL